MESLKGVEVILSDLEKNPRCPHGPTILFKRTTNGDESKYYACSACRDRKDCNFFWKFEDEWTPKKQEQWNERKRRILPNIDRDLLLSRLKDITKLKPVDRVYCHTCNSLLIPEELCLHTSHEMTKSVSDYLLTHPSELLKPLESAKKEAQYLFSKRSTEVIVQMLRSAGIHRVLCVGAPRIHELIRGAHLDMKTMLLDFDQRYHQFYDRNEYSWFNAFNCHWFGEDEEKSATVQFLQAGKSDEIAIVTDPPFGGRVEPLAYTFQCLDKLHRSLHTGRSSPLKVMWIFPYFMEPMITDSCPDMFMLDYKVDYDNHPLFQQGHKGRKFGSPVRIFTNISPSKLPLPEEDGYKFCEMCERWVSIENRHCFKCSSCTSKDGKTYIHCDKCSRCVKPSWKHCKTCERCCLPDHKCGEFKPSGCFVCHMSGHRKNQCPLRKNVQLGNDMPEIEKNCNQRRPEKSVVQKKRKKGKLSQASHNKWKVAKL